MCSLIPPHSEKYNLNFWRGRKKIRENCRLFYLYSGKVTIPNLVFYFILLRTKAAFHFHESLSSLGSKEPPRSSLRSVVKDGGFQTSPSQGSKPATSRAPLEASILQITCVTPMASSPSDLLNAFCGPTKWLRRPTNGWSLRCGIPRDQSTCHAGWGRPRSPRAASAFCPPPAGAETGQKWAQQRHLPWQALGRASRTMRERIFAITREPGLR